MNDFAEMNSVWSVWIDHSNKPTRACVQANMVIQKQGTIKVEIVVTAGR
jgi:enamine deaminase RidA (YjgF/YER057c/UK114 family)